MMKLFDVLEKKLGPSNDHDANRVPERVPLLLPPSRDDPGRNDLDGDSPPSGGAYRGNSLGWNEGRGSPAGLVGLSSAEAAKRLAAQGANVLQSKKKIRPIGIFFAQYKDIMTLILLVCTAVSLFMGEYVEAIAIAVIVLMNGILGFVQEFRTEKTLEALKGMASPTAKVFRDGKLTGVPASELVCGDVVLLETGDRIPADGRILDSVSLESDESMLTGESIPVKKQASGSLGVPDAAGQLCMGCVITKGHCRFQVTATGMKTQMGGIASMLQEIEEDETPLQKRLAQLSKYIAVGCLLVCAVVSGTGMLRGENFIDMLITGVSLAVASVSYPPYFIYVSLWPPVIQCQKSRSQTTMGLPHHPLIQSCEPLGLLMP